jgi:lysozyme
MARGRNKALGRVLAGLLLAALVGAGLLWRESHVWRPDTRAFPVQGAWTDVHDAPVDWRLLRGDGADFVYMTASEGPRRRDEAFTDGLEQARTAGLQVGAVHVYDLCAPGDEQAANFVTMVPRETTLLPPAVALSIDSRSCPEPPTEAALQSELTTFLNQVEKHAGKPAILMLTQDMENRYHLAAVIDRNVWVRRNYWQPSYVQRPFVMWTANDHFHGQAAPGLALGGGATMNSPLDEPRRTALIAAARAARECLCALFALHRGRGAAVCRWQHGERLQCRERKLWPLALRRDGGLWQRGPCGQARRPRGRGRGGRPGRHRGRADHPVWPLPPDAP